MNCVFLILLFSVTTYARTLFFQTETNEHLDNLWEEFKTSYMKQYESPMESIRRVIWESNLEYIQRHNLQYHLGMHSFSLGMNEFGDLTHEEFQATFLSKQIDFHDNETSSIFLPPLNMMTYPESINWTEHGYVTKVKNQGSCGSCWAYSATGALEGQFFRKTGVLVSLSEQQLVDCSMSYGNKGCAGGRSFRAFDYIQKYGIELEQDYPYTEQEGQCQYSNDKIITKLTGYNKIPYFDEHRLLQAVATNGPISASMDASLRSFQFYKSGVYDDAACSSRTLNHAVLVTGYGTENGKSHWIVKNSWGTTWGQNGYVLMSRNKHNQCGLATRAIFPYL